MQRVVCSWWSITFTSGFCADALAGNSNISAARVSFILNLSVPKTSFERIWWRRSASDSVGGLGSARTSLVRAFDDTKKQPNDMSPSRICEEWRLFRRQNDRNDDAVRQLEEFARSDPWLEAESVD